MTPRTQLLASATVLCATACGGGGAPLRASAPTAPVEGARCKLAASQTNPLVTEWPASEKANLEVLLRAGGVAVAYSGCEMRLLPECSLGGAYVWQRTTPATDALEIRNADELYAKLPLGAVALEGELKASGRLSMQTTVSGQLRLSGVAVQKVQAAGACRGATHLVSGLTVGAFNLKSGGDLAGGAKVNVSAVGSAQGSTTSSEVVVRQAGNPSRCGEASDLAANAECSSPLQMFLQPLPDARRDQAPAGTIAVNFITGDPEVTWDVLIDNRAVCATPCTRFVRPTQPVLLREKDPGFLRPASTRQVDTLHEHALDAPLDVVPHSKHTARRATAITFVSLAGVASAAGLTLTAVGCATDSRGVCTAGLITAPIGLAALGGSLWWLVTTPSNYDVYPAQGAGKRPFVGLAFTSQNF
jgi:hypothetical protein